MIIIKVDNEKEKAYYTLNEARRIDYRVEPIICPSCKHIGEVDYNQELDYFNCAWCGKTFKGKGE